MRGPTGHIPGVLALGTPHSPRWGPKCQWGVPSWGYQCMACICGHIMCRCGPWGCGCWASSNYTRVVNYSFLLLLVTKCVVWIYILWQCVWYGYTCLFCRMGGGKSFRDNNHLVWNWECKQCGRLVTRSSTSRYLHLCILCLWTLKHETWKCIRCKAKLSVGNKRHTYRPLCPGCLWIVMDMDGYVRNTDLVTYCREMDFWDKMNV